MDDRFPKRPEGAGIFYIRRTPGRESETIEHGVGGDLPASDLTLHSRLDAVIATLEPYEFVVSDRLHGGLIALMMRKKVILLPVGYHKMHAFYETWLAGIPIVAFVDDQDKLAERLARSDPSRVILRLCFAPTRIRPSSDSPVRRAPAGNGGPTRSAGGGREVRSGSPRAALRRTRLGIADTLLKPLPILSSEPAFT